LKIHYGVFNLKTKNFGQIEGSADKRTLRVHWRTKSGDVLIENVSISGTIRKVLEESIEYKALVEPQTCLWLFREHPDQFFATLVNYRDQGPGSALKESKILGKKTATSPRGKSRSSSVEDSFRDGLRDASGALLFPDFELFEQGWKKAIEIWAKEENPPVLVQSSGTKVISIKPCLGIEIEPDGSIPEGSAIAIEELFDQDLASVRKWFESFKPSSSLDSLLKAAFAEKSGFKNDSKFWDSLSKEEVRLPQDVIKKALSLAIRSAKKDITPVVTAYLLAKKFEVDPSYLEGDENLEGLATCARFLAEVEDSPLAKIWLTEICQALENFGFKFVLDRDIVLVESRLKLQKSDSQINEILLDLADWLTNRDSQSEKKNKIVAASIQRLLSGLTGDFSAARVSILEYCIKNQIDISSGIHFNGISISELLSNDDLFRVVMSETIADKVGLPLVTRELDGDIELAVLISMLNIGQPLLKMLKKWELTEKFNSRLSTALSRDPLLEEFIVPKTLQTQLRASNESLKDTTKELAILQESAKSTLELVARLEIEIATLKTQLTASQTANDELVASKVLSAIYTTSKALASVLRTINRDVEVLPKGQIVSSVESRLLECGIKPKFSPGEVLAFEPGAMSAIDKDIQPGTLVEVIESAQELSFQDRILVLTPALVRSIMRT